MLLEKSRGSLYRLTVLLILDPLQDLFFQRSPKTRDGSKKMRARQLLKIMEGFDMKSAMKESGHLGIQSRKIKGGPTRSLRIGFFIDGTADHSRF